MAQATGVESAKDAKVEVSLNGTDWTDISGAANSLQPSGWNKQRAETYTFTGNNPIVTVGKNELGDVAVTTIYTETDTANDAFDLLDSAYDAGDDVYLRWSPLGGGVGDRRFATVGKLTALNFPGVDASTANPLMTGFTLRGGRPTASIIAS